MQAEPLPPLAGRVGAAMSGDNANVAPPAAVTPDTQTAPPAIAGGANRYVTIDNTRYVALEGGSPDLGQLAPDAATAIGKPAAPIRLPEGEASFGEIHIGRDDRAAQLATAGYDDRAAFVHDVATNYSEIWQGKDDSLMLVRRVQDGPSDRAHLLYVTLKQSSDGQSYDVMSGGVFRGKYPEGQRRTLLWQRERANISPQDSGDPNTLTPQIGNKTGTDEVSAGGQSSTPDVAPVGEAVKNEGSGAVPALDNQAPPAAVENKAPPAPTPMPEAIPIGDAKADPVTVSPDSVELARKFIAGEPGTNPVQVNLGRIGSGQDIEDALALISSHLPPSTGVQTHESTIAIAAALGLTPEDFMKSYGDTSLGAARAFAMRTMLDSSASTLLDHAVAATDPTQATITLSTRVPQRQRCE